MSEADYLKNLLLRNRENSILSRFIQIAAFQTSNNEHD